MLLPRSMWLGCCISTCKNKMIGLRRIHVAYMMLETDYSADWHGYIVKPALVSNQRKIDGWTNFYLLLFAFWSRLRQYRTIAVMSFPWETVKHVQKGQYFHSFKIMAATMLICHEICWLITGWFSESKRVIRNTMFQTSCKWDTFYAHNKDNHIIYHSINQIQSHHIS